MTTIGLLKEIKDGECRVALTPSAVKRLTLAGFKVYVQEGAGVLSGYEDNRYNSSTICGVARCWDCDYVVKVKEPEKSEWKWFTYGRHLVCFMHFEGNDGLEMALNDSGMVYTRLESLEGDEHTEANPMKEMGEIAGREAYRIGKKLWEDINQRELCSVTIIGMGHVGEAAAVLAIRDCPVVKCIDREPKHNISEEVKDTDLLIAAAYMPLKVAPIVVIEKMVKSMEAGSVIVDVSIDQGGNVETSHLTTHSDPTFVKHGVTHYCVPNIPGGCPEQSTVPLSLAICEYLLSL